MAQVYVIADDLTGAADTGVMFAKCGLTSVVIWHNQPIPDADVIVISTESRHRPQSEAGAQVRQAAQQIQSAGKVQWIYKKIDSTLRGHPGVELDAVMDVLNIPKSLIAPAFPAQGRTTHDGKHFVYGVPLNETTFGQDVKSARLENYFSGSARTTQQIKVLHPASCTLPADGELILADAERDEDLAHLIRAATQAGIRLLCGSAGLAQALAISQTWERHCKPPSYPQTKGHGVLIVAGSRHPQTLRQIATAEAQGVPVLRPDIAWYTATRPQNDVVVQQLTQTLTDHNNVILTTAGLPNLPEHRAQLARRLGQAVKDLIDQQPLAGLVLTGGDVAIAVSEALNANGLWLRGEVQSGIPWGRILGGDAAGIPVVTKAGGFGDDNALLNALQHLQK